jgi:predicted GNAT family acetyltransferase
MGDEVVEVVDRPEEGRFELTVDGRTALLVYRVEAALLFLIHTEVPELLGGRGLGGVLMEAAIDRSVRDGLTIVPLCPFARRWLERHPVEAARASIDWKLGQ